MSSKYKYLSKNIFLFGISSFGPKILVFLLVPLYTRCLTTAEYGIADVITSTSSLLMPLLILVIQDAVMRFSIDRNYNEGKVLTNSLWICMRGMLIAGLLVFLMIFIQFGIKDKILYLYLFLLILVNALYNIAISFARGIDKINVIVEMSLISTLGTCISNIVLLVIFNIGVHGYLLSSIIGPSVSVIWVMFRVNIFSYIKISYLDRDLRNEMQKFSIPLVANKLAWWINNLSDRYIVTWLCGVSSNGIYSVAYKIPTILTTCSDVFSQAWQLSAIKELEENKNIGFITKMYELYNFLLVICCSFIMILNIPLASILYANNFFAAWKNVPFLLISVVFGGLSGFTGSLFMALKATKNFSRATIIGAVFNIITSYIFVALFGPIGAALGTMLSYILIWIIRMIDLKKFIVLKINWKNSLLMYSMLFLQAVISLFGQSFKIIILQIFIIFLIILINQNYLMVLIGLVRKKIRR